MTNNRSFVGVNRQSWAIDTFLYLLIRLVVVQLFEVWRIQDTQDDACSTWRWTKQIKQYIFWELLGPIGISKRRLPCIFIIAYMYKSFWLEIVTQKRSTVSLFGRKPVLGTSVPYVYNSENILSLTVTRSKLFPVMAFIENRCVKTDYKQVALLSTNSFSAVQYLLSLTLMFKFYAMKSEEIL